MNNECMPHTQIIIGTNNKGFLRMGLVQNEARSKEAPNKSNSEVFER